MRSVTMPIRVSGWIEVEVKFVGCCSINGISVCMLLCHYYECRGFFLLQSSVTNIVTDTSIVTNEPIVKISYRHSSELGCRRRSPPAGHPIWGTGNRGVPRNL